MFKTLPSSKSGCKAVDFDDIVHHAVKEPLGIYFGLASEHKAINSRVATTIPLEETEHHRRASPHQPSFPRYAYKQKRKSGLAA